MQMPETDQIVSVDSIDIVLSAGFKGYKIQVPKGGVQKRGRKREPRVYGVRFMPKSTPGVSWEAAMNMESGIGETKTSNIYCKYMKLSNSTAMLYSPWRVLGIYYLLTVCIVYGVRIDS